MLADHAPLVIVVAPNVGDVDVPEQVLDPRYRQIIVIVTPAGAPGPVEIEDLRRKRDPFGVQPKRIVDPDKKLLRREVNRAAPGIIAGEGLGFVIEYLGREYALLEGDDLGHLVRGGGSLRLRMTEGGIRPPGSRKWAPGHPT